MYSVLLAKEINIGMGIGLGLVLGFGIGLGCITFYWLRNSRQTQQKLGLGRGSGV